MNKNQSKILRLIILITICIFYTLCFAEEQEVCQDKIQLQKETTQLLEKIEDLSNISLNALFTDQSQKNICTYAKQYVEANVLLDLLDKNLDCWRKLIQRNPKEKVYHVFDATVLIAMYSIYSRSTEFLAFFKIYNTDNTNINCDCLEKKDRTIWSKENNKWERQTRSILNRARGSTEQALKIDSYYDDAKILKAEILALQGDYGDAQALFEMLEKEGIFRDRRSFFNSWKAYIASKLNEEEKRNEFLSEASAFSEPEESSMWAERYQDAINLNKSKWMEYEFFDFQPVDNVNLMELKDKSNKLISAIKKTMRITFTAIPSNISKDTNVADLFKQKPNVILTLNSDSSQENIVKYSRLLKELHQYGIDLKEVIDSWDNLAKMNEETAYYFLFNKTTCAMAILHMTNSTKDLANHEKIKNVVDYSNDWNQWSMIDDVINTDIQRITSQKNDFIPAQFLLFEYEALFGNTVTALDKLNQLSENIKEYKKVKTYSEYDEIDINIYLSAWNSYLYLKMGDYQKAKSYLDEAETRRGFSEWKDDQKKIISLIEYSEKIKK
ncbi:MAG: hypothetical protein HQK76_05840 [Desulfobacterales bacterium]|nr:hypothetical protein [Desulfobacterales bacterium]